jgi:cytochrome c553
MRSLARPAIRASAVALLGLAALAASAQGTPGAASTQGSYAQRFASVCAACHGANGRSEMAGTPSLAGQHSFYAITQLFLFREGRRSNEAMSAIAKGMTDQDLRGFSDFIATLPPVPAPAPATPPDAARMTRGQALSQEFRCVMCHGADLSGGQQVARIAQQREEYLKLTLHEFQSGKRPGYTQAMAEAVRPIPADDLDTLAYYIARFPGAPKPSASK